MLRRGTTPTSAARDHTVKVVVDRLTPYTRYFFRFSGCGATSPVGRTQTAPDEAGVTHALRLAFVSCSNYTGGFFTAYRGLAARDDLDAILHLGDYVYEYGNDPGETGVAGSGDRYGPAGLIGVRDHKPETEMVSLADYRMRHALYKTDPDAQAAHRRHPWIVIFDDHEIANDAYATGAENHEAQDDPDTSYTGPGEPAGVRAEGDFLARRARAFQAYIEWMPIRAARAVPAPAAPGATVLPTFQLRRSGRPVGHRDPAEPQPAGPHHGERAGQPGAGRPEAASARTGPAGLADRRGREVSQVLASHRQPDRLRQGLRRPPHRGPPRPGVQRRPVGRVPGRPGHPAGRHGTGDHEPGRAHRGHPLLVGQRPTSGHHDLPG
ncbi:hypothetical protein GCM10009818_34050 [Nakamurella flavida]